MVGTYPAGASHDGVMDLTGKSDTLAESVQIREFITPVLPEDMEYPSRPWRTSFDQDSDGDMNSVIDAFLDARVNCMHPMEPATNMDIVKVREKYGTRLAFYGGSTSTFFVDPRKRLFRNWSTRSRPWSRLADCVLALVHRIPNGTPLGNYKFYASKAWEIMNRESRN